MNLTLNASPVSLKRNESATIPFAPVAELFVSFGNQSLVTNAAGSFSLKGSAPVSVHLNAGQMVPSIETVNGNGSNITLLNSSQNPESIISAGVYGMGEPTNGYISPNNGEQNIGLYQSVLGITTPSWLKFRVTVNSDVKGAVIYIFSPSMRSYGIVLNYSGSGDTKLKTTTGNVFEEVGNWGGNALFFINASKNDCLIKVELVSL